MSKKVLLATVDFPPQRGGVARYLGAIKDTFSDRVDVLYWPNGAPKYLSLVWELYRRSKQYSAIWVSHIVPVGTAALCLKWFVNKPYVLFLHGMDVDLARRHPLRRWLARLIVKQADQVVCNSTALATEMHRFAGVEAHVVYPTIHDDLVIAADLYAGRRDPFHAPPIHAVTVARLVERKGHEKVLRAMKELPNITYDIVGDGPERIQLEHKIHEFGLHDRVRIYTNVTDAELPNVYAAADVFVMPTTKTKTDREGFGIAYLEASLFGLPILATQQPGVDEAVLNGETGILIEDTHEALVAALDQLSGDPGRREQLGKAGRAYVLSYFTREAQMRKLEAMF